MGALALPTRTDPFTRLAECLRQLPENLTDRLTPLTAQFGVKRIDTALRKASALVDAVARQAPAQRGLEEATNVLDLVARVTCDVRTAAEFAANIISGDTRGTSPHLTRAALEHLLGAIPEGVAQLGKVSKELRKPQRAAAALREVMKRIQGAASRDDMTPTVVGTESTLSPQSTQMELRQIALHRPSEGIQEVATVVCAPPDLALDKVLLTTSAEIVAKNGEVYRVRLSPQSRVLNGHDIEPSGLILGYRHTSGMSEVGLIGGYALAGVRNANPSMSRVTTYPLAKASVKAAVPSDVPMEVSYRPLSAVESTGDVESSIRSEILALSGARTALAPFLVQVIERSRSLSPPERVQVLCSAFFEQDYVYSKDDALHSLIEQIPRPLRLSFLAGLRIGACETISCELQNFLAIAGVPAVVEGGALYDADQHAFCTPGHARVRCLTEPQLVIDPTRWTTSAFGVDTPSEALAQDVLSALAGRDPVEAFALGMKVRSELIYERAHWEKHTSDTTSSDDRAHNLSDDFKRRSLLPYQWDVEEEACQLGHWSELIKNHVGDGVFFDKFYLSRALHHFLVQANESVVSGTRTMFTDWVLAYLQHPEREMADEVSYALFATFEPSPEQDDGLHSEAWATLLFLADHIDPQRHQLEGHGALSGDHVRQFLHAFMHTRDAQERTAQVEELFVRVALRTLNRWAAELQEPNATKDEEGLASFTRRLIELCEGYSPHAAALVRRCVTDALTVAGDEVTLAFISGLQGILDYNDDNELIVSVSLGAISEPIHRFIHDYLPHIALSPDLSIRAFERCRPLLDSDFRSWAHETAGEKLAEVARAELGETTIALNALVHGWDGKSVFYSQLEDRHTVGAFSFYLGRHNHRAKAEFVQLSETQPFKQALLSASIAALDNLLYQLATLAENTPKTYRQTLAPLYTGLLADLCKEFSITLPEQSEIVRARDSLFEKALFGASTFSVEGDVAHELARLNGEGLLLDNVGFRVERPVQDSVIAAEVCRFLEQEGQGFASPKAGLLLNLAEPNGQHSGRVPTQWIPLVLLSLQPQFSTLPPVLGEAVRTASDLTITEGDRALWRAVMTYEPERFSRVLGSLTEPLLAPFLSKVVLEALNRPTCAKILSYAFLMSIEGREIVAREDLVKESIKKGISRFLPDIKSAVHVEAISNFLCELSLAHSSAGTSIPPVIQGNPFSHSALQEKLQSRCASSSKPIRALLWQLEPYSAGSDNNSAVTTVAPSRKSWRRALGNASGRHQRATIRSVLGSPDPYDVVSLTQYVRGDDLRLVDWKASARSDAFYVKKLERSTPVESRKITLCVDRSDMGFCGADNEPEVNTEFVDGLIGFVRSMIADGKHPALTFFSYGVPELVLDPSKVRAIFLDQAGPVRATLLAQAQQAANSAAAYAFSETAARACPTIAHEAEQEILQKQRDSVLLMVTSSRQGSSRATAPTTPIWVDPFSRRLVEQGDAVRVEI